MRLCMVIADDLRATLLLVALPDAGDLDELAGDEPFQLRYERRIC